MTEKEIAEMLAETKLPVYRGHAPVGTLVPYMVYHMSYDRFGADDITYLKLPQVTVELYNDKPDMTTRGLIESKLTENGLSFTSDEADLEEEGTFITYYYFGGLK